MIITMDDKVYRTILALLHPDGATDPGDRERRKDAFIAFRALPITRLTEQQRREAERIQTIHRDMAARREAVREKNRERARKGVETRRRNAAVNAHGRP